jgi:hypothetical protein
VTVLPLPARGAGTITNHAGRKRTAGCGRQLRFNGDLSSVCAEARYQISTIVRSEQPSDSSIRDLQLQRGAGSASVWSAAPGGVPGARPFELALTLEAFLISERDKKR